jgi:hypothetical protein
MGLISNGNAYHGGKFMILLYLLGYDKHLMTCIPFAGVVFHLQFLLDFAPSSHGLSA